MGAEDLVKHFTRRFSVLIVDDDPSLVLTLNKLLGADYDVRFALSGPEALRLIEQAVPDVVLLDIDMPGMSGIEVCQRLRATDATKDLQVVFLSSHALAATEVQALDVGGSDFITKPIRPPVVQARLRLHTKIRLQNELLNNFVYIDGLTGLANRRRFDEAVELEWRRSKRGGLSMGLIMIDIDHFKGYNDHYGHAQGDVCLREVGQAIKGCFYRPYDVVARYGGEEIVCLMTETELPGAKAKGELVRQAVNMLHLPHAASPVLPEVTVSIGVAAGGSEQWTDWREMLEAADRALYRAKHSGKNQVRVAGDEA